MTMFSIAIIKMHFQAHFTQVVHSTLAKAKPPIIAPQVGVIKLTNPFADTKVIIVTSVLYPSFADNGPIIGDDSVARPDDDGTNIDNIMCNI